MLNLSSDKADEKKNINLIFKQILLQKKMQDINILQTITNETTNKFRAFERMKIQQKRGTSNEISLANQKHTFDS